MDLGWGPDPRGVYQSVLYCPIAVLSLWPIVCCWGLGLYWASVKIAHNRYLQTIIPDAC